MPTGSPTRTHVQPHAGPAIASARRGISAMFFSGMLFSFLGGVLPVWRYHIDPDYLLIGAYFLLQAAGIATGAASGIALLRRKGIAFTLSSGCALACAALLALAFFSPPAPVWPRLAAVFALGFSAGLVNLSGFHAVTPAYEMQRAATLNLGGMLFGIGCLLCSLFLAGTFFIYTAPSALVLFAVAPGLAAGVYARSSMPPDPEQRQISWRETLADFKSPAAVLFALLLFFQFGNEGALAGWLALFLTQRLGASPATSLFLLALYWAALLVGRVVAQFLLPRVSHGRLLAGAVLLPMFACVVLFLTNNLFGATVGVLLAGGGFAVILPLVIEKIGDRFPYYHPGFFNGIFSVALNGGLLAPASLGLFAHYYGVGMVMGLPLLGSVMVIVLVLLILLESKLSSATPAQP